MIWPAGPPIDSIVSASIGAVFSCISFNIDAVTSPTITPLSVRIFTFAASSALETSQNWGCSRFATPSIARRVRGVQLFQASRFTDTTLEDHTWLVGYIYLRNSQNFPSTPELADVVTASMVPAASEGTTSPQGS